MLRNTLDLYSRILQWHRRDYIRLADIFVMLRSMYILQFISLVCILHVPLFIPWFSNDRRGPFRPVHGFTTLRTCSVLFFGLFHVYSSVDIICLYFTESTTLILIL